ncbi:MAG: RluA family pseudouridine synthase [Oscillospiraceae bacterium]|nr:RluA family pseudouridine synthase [Oscillospiraceae bacterium]
MTAKSIAAAREDAGKRMDVYISEKFDLTRSAVCKMIENGGISVNGARKEKNYRIKEGDAVEVSAPEPKETNIIAQDLNLDVLYEDGDLIVINKAQGMTAHPSRHGDFEGTLVNALLYHCKGSLSGINGEIRPGIVHRLDKNTSGVMIAAKSDRAHTELAKQIKAHTFERIYNAVVFGALKNDAGTIQFPLGRSKKDFRKVAAYKNADPENKIREAVTHYEVLGRYTFKSNGYTHLKLRLETGRTHQIRAHMAHFGHPVIGDEVYGTAAQNKNFAFLAGQCLHSKSIKFAHPISGETVFIESGLPDYFKKVLELLNLK